MMANLVAVSLPLHEPALVFSALFLAVLVAPLAAERARVPGIIGLIVAGVAIGPHGFGVLERAGGIELLGGVGLLFLMFQAGVELDLDEFIEHRGKAAVFGVTTFAVPMAIGTVVHTVMGFSIGAAVLLASAWASHTLLAYPALQRLGVVRHPALAVTVGATIITDTAALLVLAVVAGAHEGALDVGFVVQLVPSLAVATFLIMWALPKLARWFFAGLGQPLVIRFVFVVVALYASAAIAELAGIEAIVGAFLAGLALNRLIPHGSVLMEQIDFFGATFLVPVFLISVGMLVDPTLPFEEPVSLVRAAAFIAVVVVSKWLAAFLAGRGFGYGRAEIGTMFSLSVAQAAATLAAVFVGVQVGLIGERTLNAVVLVVLATSLVSSFAVGRYGPHLPRPPVRAVALGRTVLLPIADSGSAPALTRIAAAVAAPDSGTVVPLRVLDLESAAEDVVEQRTALTVGAGSEVLAGGADVRSSVRLDVTPAAGILHALVEQQASCLVIGWKGYSTRREAFFGERIDAVLTLSRVPVLVVRPGSDEESRRIVLSVTSGDVGPAGKPALELAAAVAHRLSLQLRVPLVVVTQQPDPVLDDVAEGALSELDVVVDERRAPIAMRNFSQPGDLVVVGVPPMEVGLGHNVPRLAGAVPERTLIAVAPR